MTYYNSTITLGGNTIYVRRMRPRKVPGTLKQNIGKRIIRLNTPGRDLQDYEIAIEGIIFGANMETDRDTLEALQDGTPYALVDGTHDGDYFIDSYTPSDDEDSSTVFKYSITLIQSNQPT